MAAPALANLSWRTKPYQREQDDVARPLGPHIIMCKIPPKTGELKEMLVIQGECPHVFAVTTDFLLPASFSKQPDDVKRLLHQAAA